MPVCKKCGDGFPNRVKIDGEWKLLANRKYCLGCSPYKSHNTKQLERKSALASDVVDLPKTKVCQICNLDLPQDSFGIYKLRDGWRIFSYCKACDSDRTKAFYRERKKAAVDYKGGSCIKCNYSRCLKALEFHHRDSEDKERGIAQFRIKDWEIFKVELDKCDLVCANCHREIHDGMQ